MTLPIVSPDAYDAVILDLDGVVTDTASVHARAWRRLFDAYLADHPEAAGEDHRPFSDDDYRRRVDGRSRQDGVRTFLTARGMRADEATVRVLGERKDDYFLELLHASGVRVFPGTVRFARALREQGIRTAVISASRNCAAVLAAGGVDGLFDVRVDGVLADELGLPGKPDPAVFTEAARRLGVRPGRAVVVEDALPGVQAARRGGFGLVVGIDRTAHPAELRASGADVVVTDLSELRVAPGARPAVAT